MLVKRYLVDDMPEALAKIRQDLGKDAIILSSKRVRSTGMSGLFGKKRMEVIAAVSDSTNAKEPKQTASVPGKDTTLGAASGRTAIGQAPVPPLVPAAHALNQYSRAANRFEDAEAPERASERTVLPTSPAFKNSEFQTAMQEELQRTSLPAHQTAVKETAATLLTVQSESMEGKFRSSATSGETAPGKSQAPGKFQAQAISQASGGFQAQASSQAPSALRSMQSNPAQLETHLRAKSNIKESKDLASQEIIQEVRELRKLVLQVAGGTEAASTLDQLRDFLQDQDMQKETIEHILESVQARLDLSESDLDAVKEAVVEVIRDEIQNRYTPLGIQASSRLVAFVGPTGVGKTTTIAKIAADHVLRQGRSVALLTSDTYRIAAVEQLRTYANILKVPMQVVYGQEDLKEALAKYANYDLLLLDSAGRNYGNPEFVHDLSSFLSAASPDETYLVLSLTARTSVLNKIVQNFSGIQIDRLLFTKLDETDTAGAIYSLAHEHDKPLSYVTTGQTVPDDIQIYTPERLAKLSLGEKLDV